MSEIQPLDQQSHPKVKSSSSSCMKYTSRSVSGLGEEGDILGPQILEPNSSLRSRSTTLRDAIVSVSIVEMKLRYSDEYEMLK